MCQCTVVFKEVEGTEHVPPAQGEMSALGEEEAETRSKGKRGTGEDNVKGTVQVGSSACLNVFLAGFSCSALEQRRLMLT